MLVLLLKYTVILGVIVTVCYCVSIRRGIETAKQYLKSNGIPDLDMCTLARISALCANATGEVCTVRLVNKKMEFTQFDNPCYLDLNNICESQDNIWVIKNFGPCIMNSDLRRYANAIEKAADGQDEFTNDDNTERMIPAIKTEKNESIPAGTADTEVSNTTKSSQGDNATNSEDENAPENTTNPVVDETEPTEDTAITKYETPEFKLANGDYLNFGDDEIGKIFYEDTGAVKPILRQTPLLPSTQGKWPFDRKYKSRDDKRPQCAKLFKPCPLIYIPVCLYYQRDVPKELQYYYFINRCEGERWWCYHAQGKTPVNDSASLRTNFCGHLNYINYSRFMHTISAWGHYGWLHGPWRFNRILKPHQRA